MSPSTRVSVFLALTAFVVSAPFVQIYSAQPAARYTLTAAIVDDGTVRLDRYEQSIGIDRAEHDGHLYSDKPPAQPVAATLPYAIYRAVGGEPGIQFRIDENLGLWWVTLWSSTLPFVALVVMMWHLARRSHPDTAVAATVAMAFATLLLPFSTLLYGEVPAAALLFASWLLVSVDRPSRARLLAAGLLGGLALAVEYQAALGIAVIGAFALYRHRQRAAWMVAAGVPPVLGVLAYHWLVFDHPLRTPIRTKAGPGTGLYGVGMPDVESIADVIAGPRGLVLTPIALVAVGGLALVARRGEGWARWQALVGLAIFVAFLLLQAGWPNPWGGEMPGPRYLIPALPFLVVGAAEAFRRWRILAIGTTAVGTAVSVLPTISNHLVGLEGGPVATYLHRLGNGEVTPTVFTMAVGWAGWAIHAALVVAVGWGLWRAWTRMPAQDPAVSR